MRRPVTIQEYIQDRVTVNPETGCWEWAGHCNGDGYAISLHRGKHRYAHRASYEAFVGPIPSGLTIDHLCRNRPCVNPKHLEPVTQKVNVLRGDTWGGKNSRKTHCPQGHPYDLLNTIYTKTGRLCRECHRKRTREDNYRRRRERGQKERFKDRCPQGHLYTPENTYYEGGKWRRCKECRRLSERKPGGYIEMGRPTFATTHCPKGHEFTPENTYVYVAETKSGPRERRYCKECNREAARERARRLRA